MFIFYGFGFSKTLQNVRKDVEGGRSTVFGYYVKMPKYAPIIFPTSNYEYNPKPGDLMVFPGHIQHEVKAVDDERIMIAGTLINTYWEAERNLQNSSIKDVLKYNN